MIMYVMTKIRIKEENVEKEDQKPIFNFVIKDLIHNESFGFIDSFKMKYFVYPTNMINELLMQANYVNSFMNIMIFEELDFPLLVFHLHLLVNHLHQNLFSFC